MNVSDEIYLNFTEAYGNIPGSFSPENASITLAKLMGDFSMRPYVEQIMLTPEVQLWPDVMPFLKNIYSLPGHYAKVWTEGQVSTPENRGYQEIKLIRSGLSTIQAHVDQQKQNVYGSPFFICKNKCNALKANIACLSAMFDTAVFIDDNLKKSLYGGEIAQAHGMDVTCYQMHRFNHIREKFDPNAIHITTFDQIDISKYIHTSCIWFVDMDNTCINLNVAKRKMTDRLIGLWDELY